MQSLCTLRNHCRQWPRNTRYQADATPYLGRTFTGWIAPASAGALIRSPRRQWRAVSAALQAKELAVLRLITKSNLTDCTTGKSEGLPPLEYGRCNLLPADTRPRSWRRSSSGRQRPRTHACSSSRVGNSAPPMPRSVAAAQKRTDRYQRTPPTRRPEKASNAVSKSGSELALSVCNSSPSVRAASCTSRDRLSAFGLLVFKR